MNTTEEGFLQYVAQLVLAGAFGLWAWVVKTAADKHLDAIERIETKLELMTTRISVLETKMELYHGRQIFQSKDDR